LTWLNQDIDSAVITVNRAYDDVTAGSIFAYSQRISIWDGYINVLDGHVSDVNRSATDAADTTVVTVGGVWWGLTRTIYTNDFVFKNGTTKESSRLSTATYTTFHTLINHILDRYKTLTGLIRGWSFDIENFYLPRRDFVNATYGEIIRWAMRWIPGAVMINAYNSWPLMPHILFMAPQSIYKTTVSTDNNLGISWKSRNDLLVSKAVNTWEVPAIITNRNVPSGTITSTQNSFYFVGQDSSGTGGPTGVLFYNGVMDGSAKYDVLTQDNPLTNAQGPLSVLLAAANVEQLFKRYLEDFPHPEWTWVENNTDLVTYTPLTTIVRKSPAGIAFDYAHFYAMDKSLKIVDEMMAQTAFTNGYTVFEIRLLRRLKTGPHSGVYTYQQFDVTFLAVDNDAHPSRTFTDFTDVPTAPTGIAANVVAGMQAFAVEGQIALEYLSTGGLGYHNRITLTGLDITAPIQRTTINAFSNTVTYQFGPPQHLGPNDWLEFTKRK
jgi:hypothetical protein